MDEKMWIAETLAGNVAAFNHLVNSYYPAVYNLAYRMLGRQADAEDAAQEAFVRAYEKLRTYDSSLNFRNWLLAIAAHLCVDQLRRKHEDLMDEEVCRALPDSSRETPEAAALRHEQERTIRQLLGLLPDKYRMVIVLRYWYDMSYAEIGQTTGLEESTVKIRLYRARQMLLSQASAAPQNLAPRLAAMAA